MPNRILREGINSSPRVDQLSPLAEIMYRRLMSVADDYGRYYGSARTVRGGCWPTHQNPPSEDQVEDLLRECSDPSIGLIRLYTAKGQRYLEIIDFNQQTRSKSKFPQYDINPPATRQQPDSNPLADAEQLLSTTRARTSPTNEQRQTHSNTNSARFEEFVKPWPRMSKPDQAAQAWLSYIESREDESAAFAARDRYLASDEVVNRKAVMEPSKWLMEQKSAKWCGKWPPATARAPAGTASSTVDRAIGKMLERIEKGERPA